MHTHNKNTDSYHPCNSASIHPLVEHKTEPNLKWHTSSGRGNLPCRLFEVQTWRHGKSSISIYQGWINKHRQSRSNPQHIQSSHNRWKSQPHQHPERKRKWKLIVMAYNLTAKQIKGTLNNAPDVLSQNPISNPLQHKMLAKSDVNHIPGSGIRRCFGVGGWE